MSDGPIKVLALVGDESGCTLWRVYTPFDALQRLGYPAEWIANKDQLVPFVAPEFDLYVLPRISWYDEHLDRGRRFVESMHRAGKVVVFEADDDLFSPWIVPQQKATVQRHKSEAQLERERLARIASLQLCDGVTVSTPRLASVVSQYVRDDVPIEVVPNYLDWRWFRAVQRAPVPPLIRAKPGVVVVGWAGGNKQDSDIAAMAVAWGQIAQRYPHVLFVVQGFQPPIIKEHVPAHRLLTLPWLSLYEYPLGMKGMHIGCAPLQERPFNRCKTPIKAYEYAASGAAVVASPTVYASVIEHGETGMLARTADEWEAALALLVEDRQTRRRQWRALRREVAAHYTLERNVLRWPVAWERIAEQTRQRESRVLRVS